MLLKKYRPPAWWLGEGPTILYRKKPAPYEMLKTASELKII